MESSGGGQQTGISDRLTSAVEDLRRAAEEASGEARSRIESALEQVRQASEQATAQLDQVREWVQSAGADLLDEIQKEIDKRREQLFGSDEDGAGGGPGTAA
jgi:hypothetical protein